MSKFLLTLAALLLFSNSAAWPARAAQNEPLKVVMFVGGGYHDYKQMPRVLAKKIEELANVKIDVKPVATAEEMADIFKNPKFANGYDAVIYDICFGEKWKDGDYDGALEAAEAGKPAVFIHCSAHTYRPPRDPKAPDLKQREAIADAKWHALVGMDTRVHDPYRSFSTEKAAGERDQPILKNFPDDWKTAGDELYNTVKLMATAEPLLTAKSPSSGKTHIVAWVNHYGKARVFGTTLGHDMKTGADPDYQRLLAFGLLWACDKLGTDGHPLPGCGGLAQADDHRTIATAPEKAVPRVDVSAAALVLPGKGLAEHDFFYAGESKQRKMFIVKKGQIVWTYDDPDGKGEISDAVLLSNGDVVLAHQFAVKKISPEKKVLWNYDAPQGCEIHTAQPIGRDHVVFLQNGNPALVKVVNINTKETVKEFPIPVKNAKSVHGQFRHARLTAAGTLMVGHMDLGKVSEYDATGKELWSIPAEGVWGVTPLKNGNVLLVDRSGVREVSRKNETVWKVSRADLAEYKPLSLQLAWRLSNGNTLINNWVNQWNGPVDKTAAPIQALVLTPDKKVVWALRSWSDPDLGPATTLQILDEHDVPEDVIFGDLK
ncbi:MAG TPA: ThuA domain-containing protein [Pirellulales bacterium]|jgi:hypothetical protein|nr:ThuA domain-containing protein [Pirellulales bacterium]